MHVTVTCCGLNLTYQVNNDKVLLFLNFPWVGGVFPVVLNTGL